MTLRQLIFRLNRGGVLYNLKHYGWVSWWCEYEGLTAWVNTNNVRALFERGSV